jgi:hypothetical protein
MNLAVRRCIAGGLGTLVVLTASAGLAQATYSYKSYNTTVGKFNGNGYTGTQTKTDAYEDGEIYSENVGGSYKVDGRLENYNGAHFGSTWQRLGDRTWKQLPNLINSGWSTRVHFSNDLTTRVDVQVYGKFRAR